MISGSQRWQTTALLLAIVLVGANAFVLSPILAQVAEGLGTEPFRVAWSISAFGAATAASALTLARSIDRFPAGRVLGAAALLLALAQALSCASNNWLWLCLAQGLAGAAAGVLVPGIYSTAIATAPKGRESARLGVVLTGWALSLALAVPFTAVVAETFGWRSVYALLGSVSVVSAFALMIALRGAPHQTTERVAPLQVLRLPGTGRILLVIFITMTAAYGAFAFFGDGMRQAFDLSASGTGMFVLAYGLGWGVAGVGLGIVAPRITRRYVVIILLGTATTYLLWRFALSTSPTALALALVWGMHIQLGLNALVVALNHRAPQARGALMGLNTAVTYSAVFLGPAMMGPVYARWGFVTVGAVAGALVLVAALASWKAFDET